MLPESEFLKQCEMLTTRASGPGGMHRDHNATAVRVVHKPSGLEATASERREQSLNRKHAIERLRRRLAISLRQPLPASMPTDSVGWFRAGKRSAEHLAAMALALDALDTHAGRMADAALCLKLSTGQFSRFLEADPDLWTEANRIRERHGRKRLRKG